MNREKIKCEWKPDEYGAWETSCLGTFEIMEGTPADNSMKYCPFCGREIAEVRGE